MSSESAMGVIGGSGLYEFPELTNIVRKSHSTAYGAVDAVIQGEYEGKRIYFIPRHGLAHNIPPHKVNYRANVQALYELGVDKIVAFNATGGIGDAFYPGRLIIPDQVVDYSYGRDHTFFDGEVDELSHIEFASPFDENVRLLLQRSMESLGLDFYVGGTYGCTQGPRLETAAEILKLQKDGCDVVGMTAMPEAALARERRIPYASLTLVVNWCAGLRDEVISLDKIMARLDSSVPKIREVILKTTS